MSKQPEAPDVFRPANLMSQKTKKALVDSHEKKRLDAIDKGYVLERNDGWRAQKHLWANADEDCRRDWLYDMALWGGVRMGIQGSLNFIARYFAINVDELAPYAEVLWMGDCARVLKIDKHSLQHFLANDKDSTGKFNLQNKYAYKEKVPMYEDGTTDKTDNEITIKVIGTDQPEEAKPTTDGAREGLQVLGELITSAVARN